MDCSKALYYTREGLLCFAACLGNAQLAHHVKRDLFVGSSGAHYLLNHSALCFLTAGLINMTRSLKRMSECEKQ